MLRTEVANGNSAHVKRTMLPCIHHRNRKRWKRVWPFLVSSSHWLHTHSLKDQRGFVAPFVCFDLYKIILICSVISTLISLVGSCRGLSRENKRREHITSARVGMLSSSFTASQSCHGRSNINWSFSSICKASILYSSRLQSCIKLKCQFQRAA